MTDPVVPPERRDGGWEEEWSGPDDSRPYPQPDHSIAPRKPRTIGGAVYLAVLAATIVGIGMVVADAWRQGLTVIGVAMMSGGVLRLLLPNDRAGMLHIRRKLVDVVTLLVLGGGLVLLAAIIPPGPGTP